MSDFFGGILDSVRSLGDDAAGFLSSLGGGTGGGNTKGVSTSEGFYDRVEPPQYKRQSEKNYRETPADFNTIEYQWLRRLQRFNDIQTETKVGLGKPQ